MAPTELEGKQDHGLVVRDLIPVCADYQGLLRLNKCWMKTRHFTTTSPRSVLCKEAVAWAVPAQSLIRETWAASEQRKRGKNRNASLCFAVAEDGGGGSQISLPPEALGRRVRYHIS